MILQFIGNSIRRQSWHDLENAFCILFWEVCIYFKPLLPLLWVLLQLGGRPGRRLSFFFFFPFSLSPFLCCFSFFWGGGGADVHFGPTLWVNIRCCSPDLKRTHQGCFCLVILWIGVDMLGWLGTQVFLSCLVLDYCSILTCLTHLICVWLWHAISFLLCGSISRYWFWVVV